MAKHATNSISKFFTDSPIYNPRPRYTLEEIAQRYAMSKGLRFQDVLRDFREVMYGVGVVS